MPFIISCGRTWYQKHSKEEGRRAGAVREDGSQGWEERNYNLGQSLPTNQVNKRRRRHGKDPASHGRLNSGRLNSAMREHPPPRDEEEREIEEDGSKGFSNTWISPLP